jgi:hypothetical protein
LTLCTTTLSCLIVNVPARNDGKSDEGAINCFLGKI